MTIPPALIDVLPGLAGIVVAVIDFYVAQRTHDRARDEYLARQNRALDDAAASTPAE